MLKAIFGRNVAAGKRKPEKNTGVTTASSLSNLGFYIDEEHGDIEQWKSNFMVKWILFCGKTTKGGNPARDHLANERTILAYIRTALNMVVCGMLLLQLGKYIVIAPINSMRGNFALDDANQKIYNEVMKIFDCVNRFSKPLGGLLLALSLVTLVFGGVRYVRIFQLLFSDYDAFESGLIFNLVIFFCIIAIVILAFVYTYFL